MKKYDENIPIYHSHPYKNQTPMISYQNTPLSITKSTKHLFTTNQPTQLFTSSQKEEKKEEIKSIQHQQNEIQNDIHINPHDLLNIQIVLSLDSLDENESSELWMGEDLIIDSFDDSIEVFPYL